MGAFRARHALFIAAVVSVVALAALPRHRDPCLHGNRDVSRVEAIVLAMSLARERTETFPSAVAAFAPELCVQRPCALDNLPADPWGHSYLVHRGRVVSTGPNGRLGDGDDITGKAQL